MKSLYFSFFSFLIRKIKDFSIIAQRDKPLNLTCYATVGCNDSGYKLGFATNITEGDFDIVSNQLDRGKCLHRFNELLNYTQTMVIPTVSSNGSMVQCEIKFGTAFSTKSPRYFVFFAEEAFIKYNRQKSIVIDYSGVTDYSSFLTINVFFEASESFYITWRLNDALINTKDTTKYVSECIHSELFNYECFLFIDPYTKQDVGIYSAIVRLKSNPDLHNIELRSNAIMPSNNNITYFFHLFM